MANWTRLPQMIKTALDQYGPEEAICLVENEAKRSRERFGSADEVYKVSDRIISDTNITCALKASSQQLSQYNRMIVQASSLEPEEWVLTITLLSSYYCTHIFASRRGFSPREDELLSAMELLKEFTSDYKEKRFERALASARLHNPNPLPPPL